MWDRATLERKGHVDFVLRTAACLGALGYSPHEVVCIIAEQLDVERSFVADTIRRSLAGSQASAA